MSLTLVYIAPHQGDGQADFPQFTWQTEANVSVGSITPGVPMKLKAAGSKYVIPCADAEPVIGTTTKVVGIAASTGTQTASADGTVVVYKVNPDQEWVGKAKSASAVDTAAEIAALEGKQVLFDLTAGVFTIDTAAVQADANGIYITGGNPTTGEIYFKFFPGSTLAG